MCHLVYLFVYNVLLLCRRTVCGRRVRVEHALQSGTKKEYKYSNDLRYNIPRRSDRRYDLSAW